MRVKLRPDSSDVYKEVVIGHRAKELGWANVQMGIAMRWADETAKGRKPIWLVIRGPHGSFNGFIEDGNPMEAVIHYVEFKLYEHGLTPPS